MADLISRQDAVSEINVWIQRATDNETDMAIKEFLSFLKERIQSLPSAEPKTKCIAQIRINRDDMEDLVNKKVNEMVDKMAEPKTGKWIEHEWAEEYDGLLISNYECTNCHSWERNNTDYCPNCGSYNGGEEE